MVKQYLIFLFCLFLSGPVIAGDCDKYKKDINVDLKKAEYEIKVQPSDKDLWPVGGFVDVKHFSKIVPSVQYVFNGKYFCVFLDSVDATVGFEDFVITIDKKYEKDSCEYNSILKHENNHVSDAVNALDNVYDDLKSALNKSANSIQPIYVKNADDVPKAFDEINQKVVNDKKLTKVFDKFKKQIDDDKNALDSEPNDDFNKCVKDKVDAAFEKYNKEKNNKK